MMGPYIEILFIMVLFCLKCHLKSVMKEIDRLEKAIFYDNDDTVEKISRKQDK